MSRFDWRGSGHQGMPERTASTRGSAGGALDVTIVIIQCTGTAYESGVAGSGADSEGDR